MCVGGGGGVAVAVVSRFHFVHSTLFESRFYFRSVDWFSCVACLYRFTYANLVAAGVIVKNALGSRVKWTNNHKLVNR